MHNSKLQTTGILTCVTDIEISGPFVKNFMGKNERKSRVNYSRRNNSVICGEDE